MGEIMNKIKEFLKNNYKYILVLIVIAFIFLYPLPYYIEAPGGVTNLNDRISIDNYSFKKIDGSYNLSYVTEYKATLASLIYARFNKNFDIYKKSDVLLDNETDKEYNLKYHLYLDQSLSNAVIASYKELNLQVKEKEKYLYVGYVLEQSDSNLVVGDDIKKIDNINVSTKEEINSILSKKNVGDKVNIEVINNGEKFSRYATVMMNGNNKIIGVIPIEYSDYEIDPKVSIKMNENESGSSGGLMLSLAIYDLLSEDNLAQGRKIVGTGTIDKDGNVGEIGGVEYKIKGAVKDKADIFFVPVENYKEAKKVVDKNHYKIKLIKVSTLKEAINYLK